MKTTRYAGKSQKSLGFIGALVLSIIISTLYGIQVSAGPCNCLVGACESELKCLHRENTQQLLCQSVCRAAAAAEKLPLIEQYPSKAACDIHLTLFNKEKCVK